MAEPKSELRPAYQQSLALSATLETLKQKRGAEALVVSKNMLDIIIVYLKFENNNKREPIVFMIQTTGKKKTAQENLLGCCKYTVDSVFRIFPCAKQWCGEWREPC